MAALAAFAAIVAAINALQVLHIVPLVIGPIAFVGFDVPDWIFLMNGLLLLYCF